MNTVETLLTEFMAEHRAGGKADPIEFVRRASPTERRELATLIDGYLARAPRTPRARQPSPEPRAEATIEALSRSIGGAAGRWPALLPQLRNRAGLKRRELVDQLAGALGVSGRESKVGRYYHEMELGLLPASGVSTRVLEALAKLVGTTASELRNAGAALGEGTGASGQVDAFARTAFMEEPLAASRLDTAPDTQEQWDEVDELFRGSS
jgi:hypothetical protein